jgi:two-component system, LytTR family, sensor kinase
VRSWIRRRPALLAASIWIAPAVLAMVQQVLQGRLEGSPPPALHDLLFSGGDWLVYAVLTPPIFFLVRRWPIAGARGGTRTALHLAFALLFCVAWAVSGKLLQLMIGLLIDRRALEQGLAFRDWIGWILITLPFGVVVYVCVAGMAHAIRYFTEVTEREVQVARLSEQLSGARFAALQAQVNPHFLFNTLNTIAVRARDGDTTGTVRMVEQLSEMLRRTLSRHRANEVRLDEELELVRQYLAIEQERFSDRLRPVFAIEPELTAAAIPSFALQHLVENAIRHGIARRSGAGALTIRARRAGGSLEVTVEDDGAGLDERKGTPAGRGIENTRERLRALYGDRGSLDVEPIRPSGTRATLRVPYRELEREADPGA